MNTHYVLLFFALVALALGAAEVCDRRPLRKHEDRRKPRPPR